MQLQREEPGIFPEMLSERSCSRHLFPDSGGLPTQIPIVDGSALLPLDTLPSPVIVDARVPDECADVDKLNTSSPIISFEKSLRDGGAAAGAAEAGESEKRFSVWSWWEPESRGSEHWTGVNAGVCGWGWTWARLNRACPVRFGFELAFRELKSLKSDDWFCWGAARTTCCIVGFKPVGAASWIGTWSSRFRKPSNSTAIYAAESGSWNLQNFEVFVFHCKISLMENRIKRAKWGRGRRIYRKGGGWVTGSAGGLKVWILNQIEGQHHFFNKSSLPKIITKYKIKQNSPKLLPIKSNQSMAIFYRL